MCCSWPVTKNPWARFGHIGNRLNVLRLDGSVRKSRVPLMMVCVREPWEKVRATVEAADRIGSQ